MYWSGWVGIQFWGELGFAARLHLNKQLRCCLVWAQLFFSAACLTIFAFPYVHIGSARDFLRWCLVVPFYCGISPVKKWWGLSPISGSISHILQNRVLCRLWLRGFHLYWNQISPRAICESLHSDWNVPRMLDDITRYKCHISHIYSFLHLGCLCPVFCVLRRMHIYYT